MAYLPMPWHTTISFVLFCPVCLGRSRSWFSRRQSPTIVRLKWSSIKGYCKTSTTLSGTASAPPIHRHRTSLVPCGKPVNLQGKHILQSLLRLLFLVYFFTVQEEDVHILTDLSLSISNCPLYRRARFTDVLLLSEKQLETVDHWDRVRQPCRIATNVWMAEREKLLVRPFHHHQSPYLTNSCNVISILR